MNYKIVLNVLGKVLFIGALLLLFPLIVSLIYHENLYLSYLIPCGALLVLGLPFVIKKIDNKSIYAKEGFVIVAFSWIILSLVGTAPFIISGAIPNFFDAFFETVSGFTTTGASVVSNVEELPMSINFWRLFTHWIGGMGVLVFILTILPNSEGAMHIYRAEAPGPSSSKLVSKLKFTARILYAIYFGLTLLEAILLKIGGMPFFDSIVHALSTAGTGGFSIKNASIGAYNSVYIEMTVAIFMFLFGINFNVFYLILIGQAKKALKSEELIVYTSFVILSTLIIAINILSVSVNFGEAIRYAFFQVTSISSSTGYSTANFDAWPTLSKSILMFLMIIGACGGSTGGGMKVSRLIILVKSSFIDLRKTVRPRAIIAKKFEHELLDSSMEKGVKTYFAFWAMIVVASVLILSIDPFGNLLTNISATLACIGNIGPGFNLVGPALNYAGFAPYSKVLLSFVMLIGRLEIMPILILFSKYTWKKNI